MGGRLRGNSAACGTAERLVCLILSIALALAYLSFATPLEAQSAPTMKAAKNPEARDIETISTEEIEASPMRVATEILSRPAGEYTLSRLGKLNQLRAALATTRERAREVADEGTLASRILSAQLASIGPPPDGAQSEPMAITRQRELLNSRLSEESEPLLRSRETQIRAQILTEAIDSRIAAIRNDRLFGFNATPLNPALWLNSADAIFQTLRRFLNSSDDSLSLAVTSLLLVVLIPLLVLVGGKKALVPLRRRANEAKDDVQTFLYLLGQDLVGLAVAMLVATLVGLGLALLVSDATPDEMLKPGVWAFLGLLMIGLSRWLGRSVFRSPIADLRIVSLDDDNARRAAKLTGLLGIAVALEAVLEMAENDGALALSVSNLGSAVLVIWGCWLTWQLAGIIRRRPSRPQTASGPPARDEDVIDFASPISSVAKLFSVGAALCAIAGFTFLAREIFFDITVTLAVIAVAVLLQRTLRIGFRGMAQGSARRIAGVVRVLPVFTGFLLAMAVLPFLAMVWGYSAQNLSDGLLLLRNGVTLGEISLSAGDIVSFSVIFFLGFVITRWLQRILRLTVLPQFALDIGARTAIVTIVGYLGIILAAIIAIISTGLDLSSLAFVAGALSVGLGFGLQSVVENFTSGLILLLERPVREGDWIEVGEHSGIVQKISVRSTIIETFDRHEVIIPNSKLITESVRNLSLKGSATRESLPIRVSFETDLQSAREVLIETASANPLVLTDPGPFVTLKEFGDSAIQLTLFFFVADVLDGAQARSEVGFKVAKRFADAGFEMPYSRSVVAFQAGSDSNGER